MAAEELGVLGLLAKAHDVKGKRMYNKFVKELREDGILKESRETTYGEYRVILMDESIEMVVFFNKEYEFDRYNI